jgi:hypothetical protein
MRQIIIPDIEYDKYEDLVDKLYTDIPFAIINATYRKRLKKGFIFFWDAEYIPDELKGYITRPTKK